VNDYSAARESSSYSSEESLVSIAALRFGFALTLCELQVANQCKLQTGQRLQCKARRFSTMFVDGMSRA
jgi:hypothetical protein